MKKMISIAILAAMVSTSAFADIKIQGANVQTVNVTGAVTNMAMGSGTAKQNIASNKGNVTIQGANVQTANVTGAVTNMSMGSGKAEQNLASNDGTN